MMPKSWACQTIKSENGGAWHHHISLVMLTRVFLLKEKMDNEAEYPLMSMRDARIGYFNDVWHRRGVPI